MNHSISFEQKPLIAGGTVAIYSRGFNSASNPVIKADTFTLQYTRQNDTTLLVTLPTILRGAATLSVNTRVVGQIEVGGFISYRPRTSTLTGNPRRFPPEGPVSLIAGNGANGVVQFFPGTGEVRPLLDGYWLDNGNARSAGPTPQPSVFLFQPTSSTLESWDLAGVPQRIAEHPNLHNSRIAAQLNDSIFLIGTHHTVYVRKAVDGAVTWLYAGTYEETNDVALSPAGNRAAIRVHGSDTGPPVFDMATGDTAYHIRSVRGAEGVAFSPDGDTLFVLGYNQHDVDSHFMVLNAANGSELARFTLPEWSDELAVDTDRGFAYFAVANIYAPTTSVRILVFDYVNRQLVGNMGAPGEYSHNCFYSRVFVGDDGVFYVCGGDVWRFDRAVR